MRRRSLFALLVGAAATPKVAQAVPAQGADEITRALLATTVETGAQLAVILADLARLNQAIEAVLSRRPA